MKTFLILLLAAYCICGLFAEMAVAAAGEPPARVPYECEKLFTFGWWGIETRQYDLGLEGLLRDMRRMSMNVLVSGNLTGGEGADSKKTLQMLAALCRSYGVFVLPWGGDASVAAELKTEPAILGWYIKDEPSPEFIPQFQTIKTALQEAAPDQPSVCLFHRLDSAAAFAPHQPLMLTDCYPLAYDASGTLIGPFFAQSGGRFKLAGNFGDFNAWGNRGVLEWVDLIRAICGDMPHWITLQVFESGDGKEFRWRQPTVADIRLQTYMAVAGGAKGINFFRYECLADKYGQPYRSVHGEQIPLVEEIGRLGAELTPLGPLLAESEVAEPLTVLATRRPTSEPGNRVEVRRLRSKTRNVDYLVVFNNDLMLKTTAQINVTSGLLRGRNVYDLFRLEAVKTEQSPGAMTVPVSLGPAGGCILSIASQSDYESDVRTVLRGRCLNEAGILDIDYGLAEKSRVDLIDVAPLRAQYQKHLASGEYAEALSLIRRCTRDLQAAMKQDLDFWAAKQDIEEIKVKLSQNGEPAQFQERLSKAYRGLLEMFWDGKARSIRQELKLLRKQVARVEAAGIVGKEALAKLTMDENVLQEIEKALLPGSTTTR